MKSKKLMDSLGMVDPALIERASTPHPVGITFKAKWISAVAAMLVLTFVLGIWGGVKLFSPEPGVESTPHIIPMGTPPETTADATPDETTAEVTPDVTTSVVTPDVTTPEATPEESTAEETPNVTVPDTSPETAPDNTDAILDLFREKYSKNIYYIWYYGKTEQGHAAVILHEPIIEGGAFGWTQTMGGKEFENHGNYLGVYVLTDGGELWDLDSAEKHGHISKAEIEGIHAYWNESMDMFLSKFDDLADDIEPDIEPPVSLTPEEAMNRIRQTYLADTENSIDIYEILYYGKVQYGHVGIVLHEGVTDHNGWISIHGRRFMNYGIYIDIYLISDSSDTAMDILEANEARFLGAGDVEALYEYWENNIDALLDTVRGYMAPPSTPESTPEETPNTNPESRPENLEDFIPEDIVLDRDMNILAGTLYYDEWLENDNGDYVGTELYNRVRRVNNNLGITLNVTTINGTNSDTFCADVRKAHDSTDPNMILDAVSGYPTYMGTLTLEGIFKDLSATDKIDFSKPWWPDSIENLKFKPDAEGNGRLYLVSGDISPTAIYEAYAVFYNTDLIERFNIADPMELVMNKKWTMDKMIELTEGIYSDLDSSDSVSLGDLIAFNFNDGAHYKALPFGMGVNVLLPDSEKGYVYSEDYYGDKMNAISAKLKKWVTENDGVTAMIETGYMDYNKSFSVGNAIFNLASLANAIDSYYGSGINYSFIPCPMFDEAQGEYYAGVGNPTSFWGIPTNVSSLDESALLLESLAADAYVHISPAIYEKISKMRYAYRNEDINPEWADVKQSMVFDMIREGLAFDACMFYQTSLSGGYNGYTAIFASSDWDIEFSSGSVRIYKKVLENSVTSKLEALTE